MLMIFLLVGFWVTLSGHFDFFLLLLGGLSVMLSVWLYRYFLGRTVFFRFGFDRLFFYLRVIWMVMNSSVRLFWHLFCKRKIEPKWVELDVSVLPEIDQVSLAVVITLTPGTISCDLKAGRLMVSALFEDDIELLHQGVLLKQLKRMIR